MFQREFHLPIKIVPPRVEEPDSEVDRLRAENATLRDEIQELQNEIKTLHEHVGKLETENETLKITLHQKAEAKASKGVQSQSMAWY